MTTTTTDYLAMLVNYGGIWSPISELYVDMGDRGAGAWLAGYKRTGGQVIDPR